MDVLKKINQFCGRIGIIALALCGTVSCASHQAAVSDTTADSLPAHYELQQSNLNIPASEMTDMVIALASCVDVSDLIAKKPNSSAWSDAFNDYLKAHPGEDNYAGLLFKTLKNDKICLKNVRIAVAFGVIAANAEVCSPDKADYITQINKQYGYALKPVTGDDAILQTSTLDSFNEPLKISHLHRDSVKKQSFMMFDGVFDMRLQKIVKPTGYSYQCAHQAGGHQ